MIAPNAIIPDAAPKSPYISHAIFNGIFSKTPLFIMT
jgi:hypothetical protein